MGSVILSCISKPTPMMVEACIFKCTLLVRILFICRYYFVSAETLVFQPMNEVCLRKEKEHKGDLEKELTQCTFYISLYSPAHIHVPCSRYQYRQHRVKDFNPPHCHNASCSSQNQSTAVTAAAATEQAADVGTSFFVIGEQLVNRTGFDAHSEYIVQQGYIVVQTPAKLE